MRIYTIEKEHRDIIADFVPEDILSRLGAAGFYAIGLFNERMNMALSGFALFYSGLSEGEEELPTIIINYLFIKEDDRYEGNGAKLIESIKGIAEDSGAEEIIASFSIRLKSLKNCFESQGFVFTEKPHYVVCRPLQDVQLLDIIKKAPIQNVKPLRELTGAERNQLLQKLHPDIKAEILKASWKTGEQGLDFGLSSVFVQDKEVKGFMIVNRPYPDTLEIVRLRSIHQKNPMVVLSLINHFRSEVLNYPEDTLLRFEANNPMEEKLVMKFFPDYVPSNSLLGKYRI